MWDERKLACLRAKMKSDNDFVNELGGLRADDRATKKFFCLRVSDQFDEYEIG